MGTDDLPIENFHFAVSGSLSARKRTFGLVVFGWISHLPVKGFSP
jgi:hypothetical protein